MFEKFNGIFYLIIFIIHFVGFGAYAYQMIIGNQKFRAKFEIDETAATIMRMAAAENSLTFYSWPLNDGSNCAITRGRSIKSRVLFTREYGLHGAIDNARQLSPY